MTTSPSGGISAGMSTYLDAMRLGAALIVFAHHASYERFDGSWIGPLSGFGHEAVVIFFVLSGFVIAHTVGGKGETPADYVSARLSRLWSVALPAIGATLLLDAIGARLLPSLYEGAVSPSRNWIPSALFVNEFWSNHLQVGSNLPFWSLSYEAAYYALFGLSMFSRRRRVWVPLAMLVIGPKILLLAPAWLCGVVAYRHAQTARRPGTSLSMAIGGAVLALGLCLSRFGNHFVTWRWSHWIGAANSDAMGHAASFLSDDAIAIGLAVHMVGMAGLIGQRRLRERTSHGIAAVSRSTFPIYLFHYPALYFLTAVSETVLGTRHGVLIGLGSLGLAFAVTGPCERLRRSMRGWIRGGIARLAGPETTR